MPDNIVNAVMQISPEHRTDVYLALVKYKHKGNVDKLAAKLAKKIAHDIQTNETIKKQRIKKHERNRQEYIKRSYDHTLPEVARQFMQEEPLLYLKFTTKISTAELARRIGYAPTTIKKRWRKLDIKFDKGYTV